MYVMRKMMTPRIKIIQLDKNSRFMAMYVIIAEIADAARILIEDWMSIVNL